MYKFKIKETECFLSYTQAAGMGYMPAPQLLLTINGRTWSVDMEMVEALLVPLDGDAQVFWDGMRQRLLPPLPDKELAGMRMIPRDDGGFDIKNIMKPKDE